MDKLLMPDKQSVNSRTEQDMYIKTKPKLSLYKSKSFNFDLI